MERRKKDNKRRQDVPRVPIETYRWEDLRRSRLRGGYPWTYLYKEPFDEELDPSQYTMEEMSKSKSSSTLAKSNDGVDILEVSNSTDSHSKTSQENLMEPSGYIVITEIPSDSESHSKPGPRGSFTIQEEEHLESESSDNISQYLDKEEAEPPLPVPEPSTSLTAENGRTERAKSEEPKRKRKQSIESSYSRKSLSKLAIVKKLKEAKDKIKMPHFSLPSIFKGSEEKKDDTKSDDAKNEPEVKPQPKQKTEEAKEKIKLPHFSLPSIFKGGEEQKDEAKKEPEVKQQPKQKTVEPKSKEKPVYIHIPLKPPSGETDEFSYLEFEEKREPKPEEPKPATDSATSETIEDTIKPETIKPEEKETTPRTITPELLPVQRSGSLSHLDYDRRRFSGHPDEIVAIEILKAEPIDFHKNGIHGGDDDIFIVHQDPDDVNKDDVIIILSGDDEPGVSKSREVTPKLSRQSSKRKVRAKSAEPERKRKLSLESSYSGRSLSKQGIMKKLKDAKDKILPIFSLSRSNSKKESSKKAKSETELNKEEKKEPKKIEVKAKGDEPKYIHIPLKPPPGESDEFSHLEFEEKGQVEPVKAEVQANKEDQSSLESPASVQTDDVHFIFLTPPSDDEILDNRPDVPETPSSDAEFFESRVDDLKKIAQSAVDKVSPESKKKLNTVAEEPKETAEGNEPKLEVNTENQSKTESKEEQSEKMVIDEEDGLKLTESAMAKQEQNIKAKEVKEPKSSLKTDGSPILKKKVSFKRRSRDDGKDGIYEDVQAPGSAKVEEKQNLTDEQKNKLAVLENSQSMSVDEEKSYLDEKIIKSASLEEDYNRWSKMRYSSEPLDARENKQNVIKPRTRAANPFDFVMESVKPARPTYVGSKKRRKKSTGSLKEGQNRSFSEGRKRATRYRNVSRDSSTGSSAMSLDVRCGCQYFQSDSLLPDRINPVGTRPSSRTSNMVTRICDHEYEPINPPPDNVSPLAVAPPAPVIDSDQGPRQKPTSKGSSTTSLDRRMLGGEPETPPPEPYTAEEIQNEIEERFFSPAPKVAQPPKPDSAAPKIAPPEESAPVTGQESGPPRTGGPGKFQQAIKAQAGKFKTKLHNMKRPSLTLPSKPNLQKLKFEKPKFNLPKMPDTTKISLPTFSLPRRNPAKRSLKQRQFSTESNAGDSKKKYFDFSTYPRIFKKKPKSNDFDSSSSKNEQEIPEFATVPRTKKNQKEDRKAKETDKWGGRDTIRIPLHPQESLEEENSREDSVERRMASHIRYDEDIDTDDAFEKENQEIHKASPFSNDYNSRWNHGSFHPEPTLEFTENLRNREYKVTDLDSPEEGPLPQDSFDTNTSKDINSSESSLGLHRRGVLEEIDSDEFFLRQKGISQDNIEVGMYLSSEIREAFKSPINALSALQGGDPNFEVRGSNQSLPETPSKRKPMKKPKRKKTPHVSQEQISFDQEDSEPEQFLGNLPPARPRRRSKRNKKGKDQEKVIPYQETIALDEPVKEDLGILAKSDDEAPQFTTMYENERMQGKEHPEIRVSDPYTDFQYYEDRYESDEEQFQDEPPKPAAPPRRNRSLNFSEHDSIMGDLNLETEIPPENVEVYKTTREHTMPAYKERPAKPTRTRSRSHSRSREQEINELEDADGTPARPARTRSRSGTRSQPDDDRTSRGADSLTSEPQPCIEEPCVQDFRDYMGYAVIDKNQKREPPLPPPRTPPRRKRSTETRFFTVPRPLNDAPPPVRPLRNYSTLGPCRPPRRKHVPNMTDEEKVDITQYIEIEEEPNRDLHSGEVIQKMRDRPLPAPPRPPRKTRTLQDDEESQQDFRDSESGVVEEAEVSTQTEQLPEDAACQQAEESEITVSTETKTESEPETIRIERRLITPTHYTFEETVTHGSLVVQPLDGARILPESEITRRETPVERTIPVTKEDDDFETSEIPEDFKKLKDPEPIKTAVFPQPQIIERIIERPVSVLPDSNTEVEVLKAHKLQVTDLDVDRLNVNELLANRIIVSEIDSGNIQANEISSKTGALKVGEIELPPSVVHQLFERLQSAAREQQSSSRGPTDERTVSEPPVEKVESSDPGQKKTPIEPLELEKIPQRPPRKSEESPEPTIEDLVELNNPSVTQTHSLSFFDGTRQEAFPQPDPVSFVDHERTSDGNQRQEAGGPPPEPPARSDSSVKMKSRELIEEETAKSETVEAPSLEEVSEPQELEIVQEFQEDRPQRPPRQADKLKTDESEKEEPGVDDEPPPRPPQPPVDYLASQPPASFYALRAQEYVENLDDNIPMVPRRRRHHKQRVSRSSSDESPAPPPVRRRYRSPEPTIPQLAGQLVQACGSAANSSIKRLIAHITNNVLGNADGNQDLHVMIIILLVLIAGLILLGYGDEKTVHYHHWEYFNPPRDM